MNERDAEQRPGFAARQPRIGGGGGGERPLGIERDECVQRRVEALDAREEVARELHARQPLRRQQIDEPADGQSVQHRDLPSAKRYSMTRGTT